MITSSPTYSISRPPLLRNWVELPKRIAIKAQHEKNIVMECKGSSEEQTITIGMPIFHQNKLIGSIGIVTSGMGDKNMEAISKIISGVIDSFNGSLSICA